MKAHIDSIHQMVR